MRSVVLGLILVGLAASGHAANATRVALTLGDLAGSEKICEIEIDTSALARYIEQVVPPDDMDFASTMHAASEIMPNKFAKMSATMQAAHCLQMRRIAKSLGISR